MSLACEERGNGDYATNPITDLEKSKLAYRHALLQSIAFHAPRTRCVVVYQLRTSTVRSSVQYE